MSAFSEIPNPELAQGGDPYHLQPSPGLRGRQPWGPMEQPYFATTAGTLWRVLPGATIPDSVKNVFAFGAAGVLARALSNSAGWVHIIVGGLALVR
jgi:hypothetical protein